jgi:hypothetical protein
MPTFPNVQGFQLRHQQDNTNQLNGLLSRLLSQISVTEPGSSLVAGAMRYPTEMTGATECAICIEQVEPTDDYEHAYCSNGVYRTINSYWLH